jgi:hypothetical protein
MHDVSALRLLARLYHDGREEGLTARSFLTVSIPEENHRSISRRVTI